ncbi:MAG: HAD family phosphatase [Alphaproteobacteria bacterium]|nr:HAD family phosphatase [Alphaproteobacteria bacterium]
MPAGSVEGVIFDLGGVLIDWDPMRVYRDVFRGDEARAADFLARICTQDWNELQDAGRGLDEATRERIVLFPEFEAEIRAYYGRWVEMIGGPIPGTAGILRELKSLGLRVFALSNWSGETFPKVRHEFPELDLFEEIFLSGDHGCTKPDAKFYRIALGRIGLEAGKLAFIDDNVRNIEGARRLGMKTAVFTTAEALRADLRALGIALAP